MKIKVILTSFLLGLVLSFLVLIPSFITNNTHAFLSSIQDELSEKAVHFSYGSVRTKLFPLALEVEDIKIETAKSPDLLSLQKVSLSKWSFMNALELINGDFDINDIKNLRISLQELQVTEVLLPTQISSVVTSLGYEQISFNLITDFTYDKNLKKLTVYEASLESPEIAKLKLTFLLNEIDLIDFQNFSTTEEGLNFLDQVALEHLNIEFKDLSLIKRYKEFISNTFSIDPMKTLAFLKSGAASKRDPANEGFETKLKESLYQFLQNPDTLNINFKPEKNMTYKDISIMMMLSPERLTQSLNLSFEVNGKVVQ